MKKVFLVLILFVSSQIASGQVRDTSWKALQLIESDYYFILVPTTWFSMGGLTENVDESIDATGRYFPDSFNLAPIIVGVFILSQPAKDLDDARSACLKGYRTNEDRIFPNDYVENEEKLTISSGEQAYLLHTRFFRKSKNLNQSRYDLVVYSKKAKKAYLVTVSVQYNDNTYAFEKKNNLDAFARRIYSYFELKN